jgi:hypothetical protein
LGNIVIDIDHTDGLDLLDAPPPTYTTINPVSGHQQVGYLLAVPVARGGQSRKDIQQLADDVTRNLTRQLKGDPAFRGFISRGPLCPEHITRLVLGRLWTLTELVNDLPPLTMTTRREATRTTQRAEQEGRNIAAFEHLRHVAYAAKNRKKSGVALQNQVQEAANILNRDVFQVHSAGPLSPGELRGVVHSVCKWTEAKHRPASARSRIHSRDRVPLSEAQQQARRELGQLEGAATKREATRAKLRAAELEVQVAGELITSTALAKRAGVSGKTALAYLRNLS